MVRKPLPEDLPVTFTRRHALELGVGPGRLRSSDLERPFAGVRRRASATGAGFDAASPDARHRRVLELAAAYALKMPRGQFFSRTTAAVLWGAPVPLHDVVLHVSVVGDGPIARGAGVQGHRIRPWMTSVVRKDGIALASPASTWVTLGFLPVIDLVVIGDFFCRVWRDGFLRRDVGRPALTTVDELGAALTAGRRQGAARLREALDLIRVDAWSPRESRTRFVLGAAGLPEPELNVDIWTETGEFLGCVDICYRDPRVVVEYQGAVHSKKYAQDVERIERLRAAGWEVIQVTSVLLREHERLIARVRRALVARGWRPSAR